MQVHTTIESLRKALKGRQRLALAPTMGNLHEGHLALMREARSHAEVVAATVFVNRLQFRPGEDFESYPRTLDEDVAKLAALGVDYLFAPDEQEMYPQPQGFAVLPPPSLADVLEGEFRPGHFQGVATVVLKLFNIAQPAVAIFGKKDYQQLQVIRAMTRELNLPIDIVGVDTVRADTGLALSSRNGYLTAHERKEAPRLQRLLQAMAGRIRAGRRDYAVMATDAISELQAHGWQPDYVTVRRQADLAPPTADDTALVILAAARLGKPRLIDNVEVMIDE